jgi:hypothetical protein
MLLWTVGLFVLVELVSNNLIEPWLYGSRTGLSAFAIIVAAIFWTWLWGPIGLLLSTPLTVCLVVIGRHAPQFAFLDVLLGNEPVLSIPERLAQRLLAGDADEATEIAEGYLNEESLVRFYENVGFPALVAIERDWEQGTLGFERRKLVAETALELVDNLSDHSADTSEATDRAREPASLQFPALEAKVICFGGRGRLDDAASAILAQLLVRSGVNAHATTLAALSSEATLPEASLYCVSYLAEDSGVRARFLVRRLRRRNPHIKVLVAFWAKQSAPTSDEMKRIGADHIEISLSSILDTISSVMAIGVRTPEPTRSTG